MNEERVNLGQFKPRGYNNPLVSVIVPSYNVEHYIDQCLTSILDNGYRNIELIVVDDRSTDSTVDHIRSMMEKDNRIRLLQNQENHNIYGGACRNIGLDHAKGKYVYFCDSDDYILPGLIPECVRKCEKLNADICLFKYRRMYVETGKCVDVNDCLKLDKLKDQTKDVYCYQDVNNIFTMTHPTMWQRFYNREFVESIRARCSTGKNSNDVCFYVNTMANARRITHIDKFFYLYRFGTPTSVQFQRIKSGNSMDFVNAIKDSWKFMERHIDESLRQQFTEWVSTQLKWSCPSFGKENILKYVDSIVKFFQGIGYYDSVKKVCEEMQLNAEPYFSVCVAAYNSSDTIVKCIDSVLNQSFRNFEVIVVDDGSTDNQWKILYDKYGTNRKVRILRNDINGGILYSKTKSVSFSSGKYVIILDADDLLLPNALDELHKAYEKHGKIDILQFCVESDKIREEYFNNNFGELKTSDLVKSHFIDKIYPNQKTLCHNNISKSYCGELIRKECAKIFDILQKDKMNISMYEDLLWNSMIALHSSSALFLEKKLYKYTVGGCSTSTQGKITLDSVEYLCNLARLMGQLPEYECVWKQIKKYLIARQMWKVQSITDKFSIIDAQLSEWIGKIQDSYGRDIIKKVVIEQFATGDFGNRLKTLIFWLPFLMRKPNRHPIKNIALHYNWISPRGGIQTFLECAIQMFRKMQYNVILVTTTPKDQLKIDIADVKVEVIGKSIAGWNESWDGINEHERQLKDILTRNKIDLFYTQDWCHWITVFNLITANECGCYTLCHYHNNPLVRKRHNSVWWKQQYDMLKYFDHCISLSSCAEQFFNEVGVHNKYIPNIITEKLESLISKPPVKDKTIDVLWVGRLCNAKGIERIPWILNNLKFFIDDKINIKIIGVWYNDYSDVEKFNKVKDKFMSDINSLRKNGKFDITMQEEYDSDNIYDLMQKSRVLMYTSIYDGYPYVIAEALANGLPVVAYSQPEIELFKDGNCVSQFIDSGYGATQIVNILEMPDEKYSQKQLACKQFMEKIYGSGEIEKTWKWLLTEGIYDTKYTGQKESTLFKMILNNI